MADIACTYCYQPPGLIPYEYQGWFILLFLFFGIIAIIYVFYLIAGENKNV